MQHDRHPRAHLSEKTTQALTDSSKMRLFGMGSALAGGAMMLGPANRADLGDVGRGEFAREVPREEPRIEPPGCVSSLSERAEVRVSADFCAEACFTCITSPSLNHQSAATAKANSALAGLSSNPLIGLYRTYLLLRSLGVVGLGSGLAAHLRTMNHFVREKIACSLPPTNSNNML